MLQDKVDKLLAENHTQTLMIKKLEQRIAELEKKKSS